MLNCTTGCSLTPLIKASVEQKQSVAGLKPCDHVAPHLSYLDSLYHGEL